MQIGIAAYLRNVAVRCVRLAQTCPDAPTRQALENISADLAEKAEGLENLFAVPKDKLDAVETEANKDLLDLVAGLNMTQNILMNTLQKHGLERFDPSEKVDGKPQKFDPNLHEATFMSKAEGMDDGDVMYTQSKGFRLNGRVLRVSLIESSRLGQYSLTPFLL